MMKYISLVLNRSFLLYTLVAAIWLTGCVEEEYTNSPKGTGVNIPFALTIPDVDIPSPISRSMTGAAGGYRDKECRRSGVRRVGKHPRTVFVYGMEARQH